MRSATIIQTCAHRQPGDHLSLRFAGLLALSSVLLLLTLNSHAAERQPPPGWQLDPGSSTLPRLEVAATDAPAARKNDGLDSKPGAPLLVAQGHKLNISVLEHAEIRTLVDGRQLAQLAIQSPGATDINLAFADFWLPEGAELYLYDEARSLFQGSWDARQNRPHREFWSPAVPGDTVVIEVIFRGDTKQLPTLQLASVYGGFRDLFGREGGPFLSKMRGSCHIDAACPQGNAWRDEIRSVARYSFDGGFLCTGTLINDVPGSLTPWFLTAQHCGISNLNSVVVYWNFQTATCGGPIPPLSTQTQSGATLRAARQDVDMQLLQLDARPDINFNVHYAGWDRSATPASAVIGIHHPQGDVKSLSISNSPLSIINSCIIPGATGNTHWRVGSWDQGTTEGGSSGSGIWNPANKRLVGFLSGGNASCSNTSGSDCYGRFDVAWNGPQANQRLRDWLDPSGDAPSGISGANVADFVLGTSDSEFSQCGTGTLSIPVQLTAVGGFNQPVNLSTSGLPAGSAANFTANPVTPSGSTNLQLSNLPIGSHPFMLIGNGGGRERELALTVQQFSDAPDGTALTEPAAAAVDVATATTFRWQALADAVSYEVQVASDDAFANIVRQETSPTPALTLDTPLTGGTTYYVRVRAINDCGSSPWSSARQFTTVQEFCATPGISIPDNNPGGVQSQISVPQQMTIANLDLLLDISHTWVGDLQVELRQGSDSSRLLVDRPGNGSCSGDNIGVLLDDNAPLQIQNDCGNVNAFTEPRYRPANSLTPFAGSELMTTWTLLVTDNNALDIGTLNRWCLIPNQQAESTGGGGGGGGGGGSLSISLLLGLGLLAGLGVLRRQRQTVAIVAAPSRSGEPA